jgi:hypothetical protein
MSAFLITLVAASCSPTPATRPAPTTAATPSSGATTSATATNAPPATGTPAAATQAFLGITLTDVRTGERFTLGGSTGKVVIVEGMAVW